MTGLIAYVGSYPDSPNPGGGGIAVVEVDVDSGRLTLVEHQEQPQLAGYLALAPTLRTLYAVDERKTDGRGAVQPPAAVHALRTGDDGRLSWLNTRPSPGARPSFVSIDEAHRVLVTANHGDFDHVEHVVRTNDGRWTTEFVYDDSTVVLYVLGDDGTVGEIRDIHVRTGHGPDPNASPQNGGHAQASPHAHCAVIDPSGRYVVVCDKGTDEILVFSHGNGALVLVSSLAMSPESGPRHLAFQPGSNLAFATLEFSSELASLEFQADSGLFRVLDRVSTVADGYTTRVNEPADVRVHPNGRFVYVNNRGEDSLAWFQSDPDGGLTRLGHVALTASTHPVWRHEHSASTPAGRFCSSPIDQPTSSARMRSTPKPVNRLLSRSLRSLIRRAS